MNNNPFETNLNIIARIQTSNISNRRSKKKSPVYYTAIGTPFRKSPTPNSTNNSPPNLINDSTYNHSGFLTL